jgi:hypothetical protein
VDSETLIPEADVPQIVENLPSEEGLPRLTKTFIILLLYYPIFFCDNVYVFGLFASINGLMKWVLMGGFFALGALQLVSGKQRWQGGKVATWFFLLASMAAFSVSWSENSLYTSLRAVTLLMMGFFYLQYFPACLDGEDQFVREVRSFTYLFAGFTCLSFILYLVRAPGASFAGVLMLRGVFRSSNSIGLFSVMTLPLIWAQRRLLEPGRLKTFMGIVFYVGLLSLALSLARTGYGAFLVSGLFLGYHASWKTKKAIFFAVLFSIFLAVLCLKLFTPVFELLAFKDAVSGEKADYERDDFSDVNLLGKERQEQLDRVLDALKETSVLVGSGFGITTGLTKDWAFGYSSGGGEDDENWKTIAEKGNTFLGNLEELGVVGAGIFSFMCLAILRIVFFRSHIPFDPSRPLSVIHLGLSVAVLGALVASNGEAYLLAGGSQFAHLFWLEVGLLCYVDKRLRGNTDLSAEDPSQTHELESDYCDPDAVSDDGDPVPSAAG